SNSALYFLRDWAKRRNSAGSTIAWGMRVLSGERRATEATRRADRWDGRPGYPLAGRPPECERLSLPYCRRPSGGVQVIRSARAAKPQAAAFNADPCRAYWAWH